MTALELLDVLKEEALEFRIQENREIKGVEIDSRKVREGDLFVAIKGFATDGHLYIGQAKMNGCGLILGTDVERMDASGLDYIAVSNVRRALALAASAYYGDPAKEMKVIGVTGTKGKTTVTHLIWNILKTAGVKAALAGTGGIKYGDVVEPQNRTTAESFETFALMRRLLDMGYTHLVMEVSSHSLELYRVEGIEFDSVAFSNLSHEHLDYHNTMEAYYSAKRRLFEMGSRSASCDIDGAWGQRLRDEVRIDYTCSMQDPAARVFAKDIVAGMEGSRFTCVVDGEKEFELKVNTPGVFSVRNALLAVCVALGMGIDLDTIKRGIEAVQSVDGRFQVVNPGGDFLVVVDYAHAPDALLNVLTTAREFKKGRLITVFGCGGDRDKTKRPVMGEISTRLSDLTVITSDNPRSEDPAAIMAEIAEGAKQNDNPFVTIENRAEAIAYAIGEAKPGDVVMIAGKGDENYQEFKEYRIHFDDREEAEKILEGR